MADELPDPNTRVAAVTPTRNRKPTSPSPSPSTHTTNGPFLPRVPYIHAHPSYGSGSASTSDLPSGTSSSGDSLSAGAHPGDSTPKLAAEKKGRHPRTPKGGKRWNKSVDHTHLDATPTTPNSAKRAPAGASRGEGAANPVEPRRSEGGMATTFGERPPGRGVSSPRPKGRGTGPNMNIGVLRKYRKNLTVVLEAKNTFCRNVTIYGHCRYENSTSYPLSSLLLSSHQVLIETSLSLHTRRSKALHAREREHAKEPIHRGLAGLHAAAGGYEWEFDPRREECRDKS
jgi:hypothetical protein